MSKHYRKTPTIFQMEATECGAASLAMIMAYYGKYVSLDKVRIDTGVSRDGCKASKILQGARKYHFEASGYRLGIEALKKETRLPCIIHWNFNHFVVFEGIKGKSAYINDPAHGRRKLTLQELDEGFTGVALFIKPGEGFTKEKDTHSFYRATYQRIAGEKKTVLYLLLLGLLLVFPSILIPVFSQVFVDDIMIGGSTNWIRPLIIAMIGTAVFQFAFGYYRDFLLIKFQNKLSLVSNYKFLSHLFRLPMTFFDQRYAGDIAGRVDNNNSICEFVAGELTQNILNVFMSLLYLILLFIYSPILTFIGIITIAVNFIIMKTTSDMIAKSVMKLKQDEGKLAGVLISGINIISTLKASGVESNYTSRVLGYYAKSETRKQSYGKLQQIVNSLPEVTNQVCNVLVLMFGGLLVIRGSMTAGMLVAFNSLLGSFTQPVNTLLSFILKIQEVKADMNRVDDIFHHEEDGVYKAERDEEVGSEKLSGAIELDNISFGYSRLESPLVTDFNFKLQSGRSIAFVGASGSGKSTVAKIISGLYLPWEGEIRVDGMPLSNVPQEILTSSIATVSQEISLFSGTIKENITMWNKNIRDEDIIKATKDACIHDVITKKHGAYDYRLIEGGRNLSGGQRQRLEIARALVTNPTILIMDEATSALDAVTEKEIVDNIKRRGCTCIIVAHRLSAIRDCDEIIVMDKGKIVQRGTHEDLVHVEGHYQNLIKKL